MVPLELLRSRLQQVLESSVATAFLKRSKALWADAETRGRALTKPEIVALESRGNSCDKWPDVRLTGKGSLDSIHHCRFEGRVILSTEKGSPQLWRSRMRDCLIGACVLENVSLAYRLIVEDGAVLRNVGEISGKPGLLFCLGLPIHPGSETKTRRLFLFDGLDLSACAAMAELAPPDQEKLERKIAAWLDGLESDFAFVGTGARIERTSLIESSFIGRGAVILGAAAIRRSVLTSGSAVGDGAIVEDSVLESGSRADSAAQVRRSLLLEFSSVERAAQIEDTVLGPNTSAAKGEITCSLVGPFVGFHHQALLIGALWPEGHGNIAYGANVGSNHTGRKADQEIRPGEGTFFGLGCSIKFPSNFTDAPYSLFATGIITQPQRLVFPFSLIAPSFNSADGSTNGLNEILPGWMWSENAYALIRNAYKYEDRNQAKHHPLPNPPVPKGSPLSGSFLSAGLFSPRIVGLAIHALLELRGAAKSKSSKSVYREKELPGLGKNFMSGARLNLSIAAYENYLRFALSRAVLWNSVPTPLLPDSASILAALGLKKNPLSSFDPLKLFDGLLQSVESSLGKDLKRGREIFHDYSAFHDEPSAEAVCLRLRRDIDKLRGPLKKRWKSLSLPLSGRVSSVG